MGFFRLPPRSNMNPPRSNTTPPSKSTPPGTKRYFMAEAPSRCTLLYYGRGTTCLTVKPRLQRPKRWVAPPSQCKCLQVL